MESLSSKLQELVLLLAPKEEEVFFAKENVINLEQQYSAATRHLTQLQKNIGDILKQIIALSRDCDVDQSTLLKINSGSLHHLSLTIEKLELSSRPLNSLRVENILFIGDLVQSSEKSLLELPNFGRKSLNEVKEVLAARSLSLNMNVKDTWQRPAT